MLTAITLENFKSYQKARLPLSALTVLIGANASGKSNAIEALRLMSWLAQGQKLSVIQSAMQSADQLLLRGRIEDLGFRQTKVIELGCETDRKEWNQLSMQLSRRDDGLHISMETLTTSGTDEALYEFYQPSIGRGSDVLVAYNRFSEKDSTLLEKLGVDAGITCTDQMAIFTQLDSPASFFTQKSQKIIPEVTKLYQDWLGKILFLDPVPARMRGYSFPAEKNLQSDGANLSGVLFNLWGADDKADTEPVKSQRKNILAFIQSLPEQDIASLSFLDAPRVGVMLELKETFGEASQNYDALLLSDGTLRVLAIAAAMLSAPEGSLVVIEEIDNGVHPSRAHHLLQQIQRIASERSLRVLLSTHNPAMLDALPDSAVPEVVFCYRDPKNGSSCLVRLADVPNYPELILQGTLGYLMTSGVLERFVKYQPTAEERKQRALDWLAEMRSGAGNE
jgi:predicted ATPase